MRGGVRPPSLCAFIVTKVLADFGVMPKTLTAFAGDLTNGVRVLLISVLVAVVSGVMNAGDSVTFFTVLPDFTLSADFLTGDLPLVGDFFGGDLALEGVFLAEDLPLAGVFFGDFALAGVFFDGDLLRAGVFFVCNRGVTLASSRVTFAAGVFGVSGFLGVVFGFFCAELDIFFAEADRDLVLFVGEDFFNSLLFGFAFEGDAFLCASFPFVAASSTVEVILTGVATTFGVAVLLGEELLKTFFLGDFSTDLGVFAGDVVSGFLFGVVFFFVNGFFGELCFSTFAVVFFPGDL